MNIYLITNLVNGKQYIGQTVQKPSDRWYRHVSTNPSNTVIGRAIKKYGKKFFRFEVVDSAKNIEELNIKEANWIDKLNTLENGYNVSSGGKNAPMKAEIKKKISTSLKGIKRPHFHKAVICVTTGEEFDSQTLACQHFGLRKGHIAESIKKSFKINGTLIFKYKEI